MGGGKDSGGWFTHTHVQIITEKAKKQGRVFQGYVRREDLEGIEDLFPAPDPLLRYR